MGQLNFSEAKKKLEEIVKLVDLCPEPLRETCFKLLFEIAFSEAPSMPPPVVKPQAPAETPKSEIEKPEEAKVAGFKLPSNMLAFSRKYEIPMEMLQKLFILDHEPILPIYKITTTTNRTAQLQKVMMILLENGLLNNALKAPYAELREAINEAGFMDSNFNKALKKNYTLFKGAVTKDKIVEGETIELTGPGYEQLAKIVKELAQPAAQ